ncbi:MAG: hypothetical protein K6F30_07950 [Lachnospiraceae bacterium]|nr:hypothetical protein [Lachnospiraceae bacterium]
MADNNNVIKFHKQIHINIAAIIFFIIFIYILFHVFTYLTTENITIYEVSQGTLTSEDNYSALAIRQEQIVTADQDGNIYYFAPNKSRVGARSMIYAIDKEGKIVDSLKNTDTVVDSSKLNLSSLESDIQTYINNYNGDEFYKTYSFKNDLTNSLQEIYDESVLEANSEAISAALSGNTFFTYYPPTSGLIVYNIDGYEGVTVDSFTSDMLDSSNLSSENLRNKETILSGESVFKLVTSDNWNLVMKIDEKMAETLADGSAIEIMFNEDNATTWCSYEIMEKAGEKYLVLSLDDSMERYADSRFISINLMLDEENGLKIPNSSIVEKTFFTIPKKYFTKGEDSNDYGLILQTKSGVEFVSTTIYYETDDFYYVDSEAVSEGDKIQMVNSSETYTVGSDTAQLEGVYNVNKGYAIFKQISVIYQNNDYTIVETGTDYGLALYDRIVLQGDKVNENDIIQ